MTDDNPAAPPATAVAAEAASRVDVLGTPEAGGLIIRGSALRTAGYVGGVLLGAAAAPFLIRHLGVADYGRYLTVVSLLTIVAAITDAGLGTIALREYSVRSGADRDRFMRTLILLRTSLTVVGVLLAAAFLRWTGFDRTLVLGVALAGAGLVLTTVQHTLAVPLAVNLRLGSVTALDLARNAATAAFTVGLVVAGRGLLAFLAIPLPVGLALLVVTVLVSREFTFGTGLRVGEALTLLKQTLPFAAASAVGVVFYRVAIVLISLVSSSNQVGYFSASFRVIETLSAVPALFVTSAFPLLARAARDDLARLAYALERMFEIAVIAGCWFALCTVLGARVAIHVFGGSAFEPSIGVLRIQGVALAATFLVATWGFALLSLRRHATLLVTNGIALVAGSTSTIVLARADGARGAALAMAATEFLLAGMYLVMLIRARAGLRPRLVVVPRVVAAVGAATGVVLLVGLTGIAAVLTATVFYFSVLVVLRAIPSELLGAFRGKGVT